MPLIILFFYIGFSIAEPHFRSLTNFVNILNQSSYLTMLATAQLMVLITRGFDLSVGTVIGMISVASSLVMTAILKVNSEAIILSLFMGWLVGLGIGFGVGVLNGVVVAYLRVSPFMATLGMMGIGLGVASTISGGFPVFDIPETFTITFSRLELIGLPIPIIICAIVLTISYFLLNRTIFGRSLYVLGGNERAAYVAGMATRSHLAGAYVVCSLIVAIVAMMLTARTGSGEPRLGVAMMFDSLMAAIIGGVSLNGGEGRILHCVYGSVFVTLISNGMNMVRVNSYIQMMMIGIILIMAIFIDRLRSKLK
jgi:ribose transport system permease protein